MKFKNHLESIKVTVLHNTTEKELEAFIPEFVSITWLKKFEAITEFMTKRKITRQDIVRETFERRTLPTALETIRLTLALEGLDMTNVTHVLRHRTFSISSQSTDHHDSMSDLDILIGDEWTGELKERAKNLSIELDKLYDDALFMDTSYYAARDFAPRAKETKLCISASIKDLIAFVNQRAAGQCQPTSDQILAMRVRQAILSCYPTYRDVLEKQMPVEPIEWIYINAITHKFNLNTFKPLPHHLPHLKTKDLSDVNFGHKKCKSEYKGYTKFTDLRKDIVNEVK